MSNATSFENLLKRAEAWSPPMKLHFMMKKVNPDPTSDCPICLEFRTAKALKGRCKTVIYD